MAGVTWTEELNGLLSLTELDFNQALLEAKRSRPRRVRRISARMTLEIDDVDRFVTNWPRRARVSDGVFACPALRGEMAIRWGVFELLGPSSSLRDHLHLRMRYRLNLENPYGGERLAVRGFKVVENDPGYDSWSDTSTLFVRIYKGWWDPEWEPQPFPVRPAPDLELPAGRREESAGAVLSGAPAPDAGAGGDEEPLGAAQLEDDDAIVAQDGRLVATAVMQISVPGFARELLTFTGGAESRWVRSADILSYWRCFAQGLLKAYWGPPVSDGCASFPRDYQKVARLPGAGGPEPEPEPVLGREWAESLPPAGGGEAGVRYALERTVIPFWVKDLTFPLNLHHITARGRPGDPRPENPGSRGPVLLVHGAGVRAEMFYGQPEGETVVDYLLREGYDVWAENWRASIDVPNNPYTIDQAAVHDHPAAVEKVMELTEGTRDDRPLRALVHCQGSVSFVVAAVAGYLNDWPISDIVSTTISLFFEVPFNTFAKQRALMPLVNVMGTGADPQWGIRASTPAGGGLARVARVTPAAPRYQPRCKNPACQIANYIYGEGTDVLLRHANVSPRVHDWTSRELGYTPFTLIDQVSESSRYGHIVPAGHNRVRPPSTYVSGPPDIQGARFTFLGAGSDRMFLASGQERTAEFFNEFGYQNAAYDLIEGYGHMDLYWGERASRDVFPRIVEGLDSRGAGVKHTP